MIKKLFYISVILVAFAWGFISHWKQYFPYGVVQKAQIAYRALLELKNDEFREVVGKEVLWYPMWEESGLKNPKATTFESSRGDENVFILGNTRAYLDICPEVGCLAWIVNRDGKILHVWKNKPDLWTLEKHSKGPQHYLYPVSGHLYPNGDILVSFHGHATFPYSIGLAKFDKDSNLLWKKENYYHHWFTVDKQGRILTPAIEVKKSPVEIENRKIPIRCEEQGVVTTEYVAVLDSDGNLIDKIDLLPALNKADLVGFMANTRDCDPFHMNMVDINEDWPQDFSEFEPGDFLISARSLNLVGVIGKNSKAFKWIFTGSLARQHSSVFAAGGKVFVLDNNGGYVDQGISRVVSIDVATNEMETVFPREGVELPSNDFYISTGGFINIHPDQKRMMVSLPYPAGFAWEIDIESGKVLWEYRNITPLANKLLRLQIYTATYVESLNFPFNHGKLP